MDNKPVIIKVKLWGVIGMLNYYALAELRVMSSIKLRAGNWNA